MKNRIKLIFILTGVVLSMQFFGVKVACCNNPTKVFSLDGKWELTGYSPDKSKHYMLHITSSFTI
jgi:hypothetical protein